MYLSLLSVSSGGNIRIERAIALQRESIKGRKKIQKRFMQIIIGKNRKGKVGEIE
jgi:hypothetical protein